MNEQKAHDFLFNLVAKTRKLEVKNETPEDQKVRINIITPDDMVEDQTNEELYSSNDYYAEKAQAEYYGLDREEYENRL